MRGAIAAVATVLVVAGCGPDGARPLQGYVEGEYVRVAAPFAGTLSELSVKRGDPVAAGAPLFALERENESAARREAGERLAAAEARLANLRSGKRPPEIEAAAEQLQQARAMPGPPARSWRRVHGVSRSARLRRPRRDSCTTPTTSSATGCRQAAPWRACCRRAMSRCASMLRRRHSAA